jgi:hypothetical protein
VLGSILFTQQFYSVQISRSVTWMYVVCWRMILKSRNTSPHRKNESEQGPISLWRSLRRLHSFLEKCSLLHTGSFLSLSGNGTVDQVISALSENSWTQASTQRQACQASSPRKHHPGPQRKRVCVHRKVTRCPHKLKPPPQYGSKISHPHLLHQNQPNPERQSAAPQPIEPHPHYFACISSRTL